MSTINTNPFPASSPSVDFSWDPVGAPVTYNFSGNTYPPAGARFESFYTPINQVITFTADVTSTEPIIQYKWYLGDGVIKYGSIVAHTYTVPNPSLSARLEVIDGLNRKVSITKTLALQVQFGTVVQDHIRV